MREWRHRDDGYVEDAARCPVRGDPRCGSGSLGLRQDQAKMRKRMPPARRSPGSQQDFVVNVGDRVFFETDSTELTPQSRATLDKQAQWLTTLQPIRPVHDRGPRRRTRHARIQHRARRAARAGGARLSGLAWHPGAAHAHDLLRQGTSGRGLQRYLLLVAEPPRRDGARGQLLSSLWPGSPGHS